MDVDDELREGNPAGSWKKNHHVSLKLHGYYISLCITSCSEVALEEVKFLLQIIYLVGDTVRDLYYPNTFVPVQL